MMKKKLFNKKTSLITIGIISSVTICGMSGAIAYGVSNVSTDNVSSSTVWQEVPINEGAYDVFATYSDFSLDKTFIDADYIFSGTIVDRTEYKVSWSDDNGEVFGPYPSSVIEVKIENDYYGKIPVEDDIIKVYYPNSLSANIDCSFQLKEGYEYIFITQAFDEEFIAKKAPEDKFEQEKHADVFIPNARSNVISISEEGVVAYKQYFVDGIENSNKFSSKKLYSFNDVVTDDIVESNEFLMLDKRNFDTLFSSFILKKKEVSIATNLTNMK